MGLLEVPRVGRFHIPRDGYSTGRLGDPRIGSRFHFFIGPAGGSTVRREVVQVSVRFHGSVVCSTGWREVPRVARRFHECVGRSIDQFESSLGQWEIPQVYGRFPRSVGSSPGQWEVLQVSGKFTFQYEVPKFSGRSSGVWDVH